MSIVTTIRDPLLEPFYLTKDQFCYTILKEITPKKGDGQSYTSSFGFYANLKSALKRIGELLNDQNSDYSSIKEYIEEYEKVEKRIEELLNKIKI